MRLASTATRFTLTVSILDDKWSRLSDICAVFTFAVVNNGVIPSNSPSILPKISNEPSIVSRFEERWSILSLKWSSLVFEDPIKLSRVSTFKLTLSVDILIFAVLVAIVSNLVFVLVIFVFIFSKCGFPSLSRCISSNDCFKTTS